MSSSRLRATGGTTSTDGSTRRARDVRYWLRVDRREIRLDVGETLIGRDETCHVVVSGTLVSRRHARIVIDGSGISVEDLGSANGTFLNRARIHGRMPLQPGDRISVASSEMEVVCYGGNGGADDGPADEVDRETPLSGVSVVGKVTLSQRPAEITGADTERGRQKASTDLDALESAGRLADRMFALGRADSGRQILSEPLEEVLAAARNGAVPGPQVVDAVGRYGVKLAQELLDGRWVDLVIEVHLAADRPLRPATLQQLLALRAKAPAGDNALIARYYERLRSRLLLLAPDDRVLCEQLAALIPRLDEEQS